MERVNVFKKNKAQTVKLPESVAFPESVKQVDVVVIGKARLIIPAGEAWDLWFDGKGVSDDFMNQREQP